MTYVQQITRVPVINGYVAVPDLSKDKKVSLTTALLNIPTAKMIKLVDQFFIEFPEATTPTEYVDDWHELLRSLA